LLTRVRISGEVTNPLKAAELTSKILKDESIIP
ncbi:penicillin binding protein transpeptidase domain-containing protein, partial [Leptospira borgpetersenii serovar Hardjo-bovis]|nr:penicillin binding protein transpeptidase domain-containing protein [Leptospira borgpetersenii serovar Hardjo-bovis]